MNHEKKDKLEILNKKNPVNDTEEVPVQIVLKWGMLASRKTHLTSVKAVMIVKHFMRTSVTSLSQKYFIYKMHDILF